MQELKALNREVSPARVDTDYLVKVCQETVDLLECSWEDFPENGLPLLKEFLTEQEEDVEKINFNYDLIWRAWKNEFVIWLARKRISNIRISQPTMIPALSDLLG
jgi:hypothetical protein